MDRLVFLLGYIKSENPPGCADLTGSVAGIIEANLGFLS